MLRAVKTISQKKKSMVGDLEKRTDTQTNLKILIMSTSLALIWSRVKVKL